MVKGLLQRDGKAVRAMLRSLAAEDKWELFGEQLLDVFVSKHKRSRQSRGINWAKDKLQCVELWARVQRASPDEDSHPAAIAPAGTSQGTGEKKKAAVTQSWRNETRKARGREKRRQQIKSKLMGAFCNRGENQLKTNKNP